MSTNETYAQSPAPDKRDLALGLSVDLGYIKSIPGILTAAITVVSLIAFICVYAGRNDIFCEVYSGAAFNFFGFVSMTAFLVGLISYVMFVLSIHERLGMVPWVLVVLIWSGLWAVLYLIASAVTAAKACSQSGVVAGAVFGFLAMLFFAGRAAFAFLEFRSSRSDPTPGPQSSSAPPPEYTTGSDFQQY